MYSPAQQGFGRIRANTGLSALGGAPGSQYEMEQRLGSTALSGKSAIDAAKARANAIEYIGKQQGRAAIFDGLFGAIGSLGSAAIGKMPWKELGERNGMGQKARSLTRTISSHQCSLDMKKENPYHQSHHHHQ